MELIEVPFFMGERMDSLKPPVPGVTLDPDLPEGSALERMAVLNRAVADAVAAATDTPMVWAGDCPTVIGVLAGLERRGVFPHLYFFDAHGDFNTWETSPSGFLGGMPLAMLTGRGGQTIVDGAGLTPLPDDRVTLVDARDLDAGEEDAVATAGIRHLGVDEVADSIPDGPLLVHVDVDVVDPAEMPGVNYPAPGGPGLDEVAAAVAALAATGRVVAASMSSWNPALDGAKVAVDATARLFASLLG